MSENILEINNLSKYFGGLAAVSDCSIKVKRGTITGIIGPNGSGKTTLAMSIMHLLGYDGEIKICQNITKNELSKDRSLRKNFQIINFNLPLFNFYWNSSDSIISIRLPFIF